MTAPHAVIQVPGVGREVAEGVMPLIQALRERRELAMAMSMMQYRQAHLSLMEERAKAYEEFARATAEQRTESAKATATKLSDEDKAKKEWGDFIAAQPEGQRGLLQLMHDTPQLAPNLRDTISQMFSPSGNKDEFSRAMRAWNTGAVSLGEAYQIAGVKPPDGLDPKILGAKVPKGATRGADPRSLQLRVFQNTINQGDKLDAQVQKDLPNIQRQVLQNMGIRVGPEQGAVQGAIQQLPQGSQDIFNTGVQKLMGQKYPSYQKVQAAREQARQGAWKLLDQLAPDGGAGKPSTQGGGATQPQDDLQGAITKQLNLFDLQQKLQTLDMSGGSDSTANPDDDNFR